MHRLMLAAALALVPATAVAQSPSRLSLELRGGMNVPTFDIADVAEAGPSFGAGLGYAFGARYHLLLDVDYGMHGSAVATGPDVDVLHVIGKVGMTVLHRADSPWSVVVNAGAGIMQFRVDGGSSYTYPAINVGAKIGYRLSPSLDFVLSPQGDIAFSDEAEVGTTNAWVWPFAAGVRFRF